MRGRTNANHAGMSETGRDRAEEQEQRKREQAAFHGDSLRRFRASPAAFGAALGHVPAQVVVSAPSGIEIRQSKLPTGLGEVHVSRRRFAALSWAEPGYNAF